MKTKPSPEEHLENVGGMLDAVRQYCKKHNLPMFGMIACSDEDFCYSDNGPKLLKPEDCAPSLYYMIGAYCFAMEFVAAENN